MSWGLWRKRALRIYSLHVDVDGGARMAAVGLAGWTGPSGRAVAHLRAVRQLARRAAARLAPSALTISGLGCIDVGVFTANTVAGWIVTGISLIVLEFRVDE